MKKQVLVIILFSLTVIAFAEKIKILSFNLQGNSNHNHRATSNEKWLSNICTLIKSSGPDIVLLQEFYTELPQGKETTRDIQKFQEKLGLNWQYFCSNKYIKRDEKYSKDQNNIIFFNNRKVLAQNDTSIVNFDAPVPKYQFSKNSAQVVEFRISGVESKKFVVVNVHLATKQKESNYEELHLLNKLYRELKSNHNVIIGGDFNVIRQTLLKAGNFNGAKIDSEKQNFQLPTWMPDKIFFDPNAINPTVDLDHFIIYGMKITEEMHHAVSNWKGHTGTYGKITIGENTYTKASEFKKDVSDHLPIIIELEL